MEPVIKQYVGLCGKDFTSLWQRELAAYPDTGTKDLPMATAVLVANEVLGCQFIDDKQYTIPDDGGLISCLVQNWRDLAAPSPTPRPRPLRAMSPPPLRAARATKSGWPGRGTKRRTGNRTSRSRSLARLWTCKRPAS